MLRTDTYRCYDPVGKEEGKKNYSRIFITWIKYRLSKRYVIILKLHGKFKLFIDLYISHLTYIITRTPRWSGGGREGEKKKYKQVGSERSPVFVYESPQDPSSGPDDDDDESSLYTVWLCP